MNNGIVFSATILIVFQVLLLWAMMAAFSRQSHSVLLRLLHPAGWFTAFYVLWFLIPQLIAILPGHRIIGLESYSDQFRLQLLVPTQLWLVMFLVAVLVGMVVANRFWRGDTASSVTLDLLDELSAVDTAYLWVCFILGVAAIGALGQQLAQSDGMRSALVKTTQGKVLTLAGFFGNFAFAVLFAKSLLKRRYILALCLFVCFATAVLFTGARGRLLWPLLIAVMYTSVYYEFLDVRKYAMVGAVLIAVLLFADPLLIAFRTGAWEQLDRRVDSERLIDVIAVKRNFDGFGNFALISHFDQIPHAPNVLLSGGRESFMNHYFAKIYASGVGFGVTYPGLFWLAGGATGLALCGWLLGACLAIINAALRRIRDERLVWAYFFGMSWLAALGGNFQESADKMIIAAVPGLIWYALSRLCSQQSHQRVVAADGFPRQMGPQLTSRSHMGAS